MKNQSNVNKSLCFNGKDIGFLQSMIIDSKLHVYVSSIITNDTIQEVVFDMDRNLIAEDQNNENSKSKK